MKTRYDPEADAIYIELKEDEISYTRELDEKTILDFNEKNEIIGIELLFVKERNPKLIEELKVKLLTLN